MIISQVRKMFYTVKVSKCVYKCDEKMHASLNARSNCSLMAYFIRKYDMLHYSIITK